MKHNKFTALVQKYVKFVDRLWLRHRKRIKPYLALLGIIVLSPITFLALLILPLLGPEKFDEKKEQE
jgi:hypothetical protein